MNQGSSRLATETRCTPVSQLQASAPGQGLDPLRNSSGTYSPRSGVKPPPLGTQGSPLEHDRLARVGNQRPTGGHPVEQAAVEVDRLVARLREVAGDPGRAGADLAHHQHLDLVRDLT